MRAKYVMHSVCKHCGQDVEFWGNRQWVDRGGNRKCVPYPDNKACVMVKPKTHHKPQGGK